ncbi:caspase family protein [Nocardioides speluncae]|uniref:caspase family protein n=1 Tax=Nocardioides speluncae TaxID=2670337 RepID=UPI0023E7A9D0|nr:caspase family protein [Nocardioides speluncae]
MSTDGTRARWAALLVGTARNDAGMTTLPTVRNNLDDLREVLTDSSLVGMDPSNVDVVVDPNSEHEVLDPLSRLADRDLDFLLFYFAGHGQTDEEGHLFLATTQTPNRADGLEWRSVEFRRVQRVIRRAVADVRLMVLDCCFAGRALDVMSSADAVVRGAVGTAGAVTWVASPASETAMAPAGERHTAFTGAILGHVTGDLRTPEADFLTLDTLVRRTRETLRSQGRPEPQVQAQGSGLDLPLVLRPARDQRPAVQELGPDTRSAQPDVDRRSEGSGIPATSSDAGLFPSKARLPDGTVIRRLRTPQQDAAVANRVGTPLRRADADKVKFHNLPQPARTWWGGTRMTHIRTWQCNIAGFPSPTGTTWQLTVELGEDPLATVRDHRRREEVYHLSLMSEPVASVSRLSHPAGIWHPVLEEMPDDFFWLGTHNGKITPDRFSMELSSPAHRSIELWVSLPQTLDEFTRTGIRSIGQAGVNLRHATIEGTL